MTHDEWADWATRYLPVYRKAKAARLARAALPPGSSRARVTTANKRWAIACEAMDRMFEELRPRE